MANDFHVKPVQVGTPSLGVVPSKEEKPVDQKDTSEKKEEKK